MQLVDIIGSVRRHWRVSVAIILLTGIGLGVFLYTRKEVRGADRWRASTRLLVPTRDKDGNLPAGVPPELLQGQSQLALSGGVTGRALVGAGLTEADRDNVVFGYKTNFDPNAATNKTTTGRGDILTLSTTAGSKVLATRLAEKFANAFIALRRKAVASSDNSGSQGAKASLVTLESRLSQVDSQLQLTDPSLLTALRNGDTAERGAPAASPQLPPGTSLDTVLLAYQHRTLANRIVEARQNYAEDSISSLIPQAFASIVERPNPVQIVPQLPSPLIPIAVAAVLGLLLAIAVPVLIDILDHTIRDPRAAAKALSAPVLGTLPIADFAGLARPGSELDAAYRALATTSVATDKLPRAIVVTSPVGDVQDTVAANFAAALAGLGLEVALVATELRQSWFADSVGAEGVSTLSDLLAVTVATGSLNGQIRERLVSTRLAHLGVLGSGTLEADDLLEGLPIVLEGLASAGIDVTVIAGPALLEDPSATILAWSTRSVLWVVEAGEVTDQEAREAASRLELAGASPFGVAMVAAEN